MLRSHALSKTLLTCVPRVADSLLSSKLLSHTSSIHQLTAAPSSEHRLQCLRRRYHMVSRCQAFVGERTESAEEYHSADFDFRKHKAAVDEQLAYDPSAYQGSEKCGDFMLPMPDILTQETCST